MNQSAYLLELFLKSLQNPQTRDEILTETGDPEILTRHAIDTDGDDITFVFDTVDGPKPGGVELLDVAILPDSAMLVIGQRYSPQLAAKIDGEKTDEIGRAIYTKYEATGGVKLSALGDPELDNQIGVFFYDLNSDGKYVVKGVGKDIQGATVDGDMTLVYMGDLLATVATVAFLDILRRDAFEGVIDQAQQKIVIGYGAKMARPATIEIDGAKKKVWTYVQKDEGKNMIHFLDFETLEELDAKPFDGTYATPTMDGNDMILVGHEAKDESETFPVTRIPTERFIAAA